MFRTLVAFLLLCLNSLSVWGAITAPQPVCVSVQTTGSVTLNWLLPTGPSSQFVSYKLFRAPALSGPYLQIASIPVYAQTSYTDNTVNASSTNYYYYLQTEYLSGTVQISAPSDTVQTIKLVVASLTNEAHLRWNAIHSPLLPGSNGKWHVYQKYPLSGWKLIDTTFNLSDTILINSLCSENTVEFKVEMKNTNGCSSWSPVMSGIFRDYNQPQIMNFDSVSIDSVPNRPIMGWPINPSPDVKGYIIYKYYNLLSPVLDTVYGRANTFYTDNTSDPYIEPQAYKIATFDSCYNTAPWVSYQQTIHLKSIVNSCMGGVVLDWTSYRNWPGGVSKYSVYASKNDSDFVLLAELPGNDTNYLHYGPQHAQNYCYVVRAWSIGNEFTSTSNRSCNYINTPKPPQFIYARQSKVLSPTQVEITFLVDLNSDASMYHVERAEENAAFILYDSISPPATTEFVFIDDTANTASTFYRYRLIAVDTCGNRMLVSNVSTSIRLEGKAENDLYNVITWNTYQQYSNDFVVEVYRQINGVSETAPLIILSDTSTGYQDDVYDFLQGNGDFCYYVEAVETGSNDFGVQGRSRSSVKCVRQLPKLFLPNAFTPNNDNLNDVFQPVNVFVDVSQYLLIIYDRRGQKIFESTNPEVGWDGTYKGQLMPAAAYPYYIFLQSGQGEPYEKAGSISVLR